MEEVNCARCGMRRDKGAHALTSNDLKIGELNCVFADGSEHWVYDTGSLTAIRLMAAAA